MLFQQTAAPTGWTKDVSHDNKALRLVNGAVGTGGSSAFTNVFGARTITQGHLPVAMLTGTPATASQGIGHSDHRAVTGAQSPSGGAGGSERSFFQTGNYSSIPDHTVIFPSYSVPLGGSGTPLDFAVTYVDVIIASKD
jgi:hypothetical protein